jgi:arginine exporter protein ArgO
MAQIGRAGAIRRSRFGDAALIAFLLAQACDGVLTYVGVSTYGARIEGNPVLGWLMATVGLGAAVTAAKTAAGAFGIALHLTSVHRVVALLTAFYLAVAVLPWIGILYYW